MTFLKNLSILTAVLMLSVGTANATVVSVDITGAEGYGASGDAGNTVYNIDIGTVVGCAGCEITIDAVGWDVDITAFGLSYHSEATVQIENSDQSDGIFLGPGFLDTFSGFGSTLSYDSGGLLDVTALDDGLGGTVDLSFMLLTDGILRLEFSESFTDGENPDSHWAGILQFNASFDDPMPTPEPGILVLFGLGLIGVVVARRRA